MRYESYKATDARAVIGDLISKVYYTKDRLELTKQRQKAYIIPKEDMELLELIEDWLDGQDAKKALEEALSEGFTSHQDLKDELGL